MVMNLALNARDAMPDGGKLTIAARPVEIDEAACARNPEAQSGPHICLAVKDTGQGWTQRQLPESSNHSLRLRVRAKVRVWDSPPCTACLSNMEAGLKWRALRGPAPQCAHSSRLVQME